MQKRKPDGGVLSVDPDDAPELTDEWFDKAEIWEGDKFIRRGRGRPSLGSKAKELVSIRLDPEVLSKLRENGPGWSSRVNGLLRQALGLGAES